MLQSGPHPCLPLFPKGSSFINPTCDSFTLPDGPRLVGVCHNHQAPSSQMWWVSTLVEEHTGCPVSPWLPRAPLPSGRAQIPCRQYFLPLLAQAAGHYIMTSLNCLSQVLLAGAAAFDGFDKSKIDEGHFTVMVRLPRNICFI